jgi:hypothetical protein
MSEHDFPLHFLPLPFSHAHWLLLLCRASTLLPVTEGRSSVSFSIEIILSVLAVEILYRKRRVSDCVLSILLLINSSIADREKQCVRRRTRLRIFLHVHMHCTNKNLALKADPLHAMKALGGRGVIAPTHSRSRL